MNEGMEQRPARSAWDRVKAVLRFEPGIFNEIAQDNSATGPGVRRLRTGGAPQLPVGSSYSPTCMAGRVSRHRDHDRPLQAGVKSVRKQSAQPKVRRSQTMVARIAGNSVRPTRDGFVRSCSPQHLWLLASSRSSEHSSVRVYNLILQIIAIRELSGISTAAAVITWLIAMLFPAILLIVGIMLFGFSMLGIFGLNELLNWH